ncbi:hypothetical protein N5853_08090 [Bartonella sp. HY329]|uniref:hypothetical protein n=1 Tax=unclassified Bartonella TaxID=2645622 RepID=UPI0021C66963|nr:MULTISPECIES: hypothetical protein [unclassified Bartonella]UXM94078.1 hypothetical protein N5853_08090 [Bartonella sp. HY329]UXN08400.1 hypothetical protein N5852_08100 [Bartonella sp. HY328]
MVDHKTHGQKIKIIDVEKLDEQDDNENGPVDTVDIFDEVTEGGTPRQQRQRHQYLDDIDNPLDNEDADIISENMYESEPDQNEEE